MKSKLIQLCSVTHRSLFPFTIALVVLLFACKKEEDAVKPVMKSLAVNGISAGEHEIQAGSEVSMDIKISDDQALNQVKVNISPVNGRVDGLNAGLWSEAKIVGVSGSEDEVTVSFDVPDSIGGYWTVEVLILDESGNMGTGHSTLHIVNENLPVLLVVTVPAFDPNGPIELISGQTITVSGTITDPDGIGSGTIELVSAINGTVVWQNDLVAVGELSLDLGSVESTSLTSGMYYIVVRCIDEAGFHGIWARKVHVQ